MPSPETPPILPEESVVVEGTKEALSSLKESIVPPSETVHELLEGGAQAMGAIINPLLVAGVIGSGLYMVVTGKTPKWMKNIGISKD